MVVRKQQERIPIVKEVIVTKFHPLTLHSATEVDCPLPTFSIDDMQGVLEDSHGHRATVSTGRLLLNAGVVEVDPTMKGVQ